LKIKNKKEHIEDELDSMEAEPECLDTPIKRILE